jgi:arabinan endo-1,5-alpha-L-arabinosidase
VDSEGSLIGPGHIGLFRADGSDQASMHFYNGERSGRPTLAIRRVHWTSDGWPELLPD